MMVDGIVSVLLADGSKASIISGIDDHSRFVVSAHVVARATSRPTCDALGEAMRALGGARGDPDWQREGVHGPVRAQRRRRGAAGAPDPPRPQPRARRVRQRRRQTLKDQRRLKPAPGCNTATGATLEHGNRDLTPVTLRYSSCQNGLRGHCAREAKWSLSASEAALRWLVRGGRPTPPAPDLPSWRPAAGTTLWGQWAR